MQMSTKWILKPVSCCLNIFLFNIFSIVISQMHTQVFNQNNVYHFVTGRLSFPRHFFLDTSMHDDYVTKFTKKTTSFSVYPPLKILTLCWREQKGRLVVPLLGCLMCVCGLWASRALGRARGDGNQHRDFGR